LVISILKEEFEAKIKDLTLFLSRANIKPNQITFFGFVIALITAWIYINYISKPIGLVYAGIMILVSGLLDALDGALARTTNQITRFGGFFDSISDRYSDLIILSGIIISGLSDPIPGLLALIGSVMVSYTRARAEAEGIRMSGVGLAERAERMIFLAICSIGSYFWRDALKWGINILAIVTQATVLQRILYFKKEVEKV
jgi:phosphatidylglycerophosphate synthase